MMKEQSRDCHNVIKGNLRSFLRPLLAEAPMVTSAKSRLFQFQVINTQKWLVINTEMIGSLGFPLHLQACRSVRNYYLTIKPHQQQQQQFAKENNFFTFKL